MPSSRSSVFRVGIITASMNRENAHVSTSTGSNDRVPSSSMTLRGGNHRSHCAASPAAHDNRSAGSIGRWSARTRLTLSRNHRIDPVHPTRSANTVAGISGVSANRPRTRASYGVNDVGPGLRAYFGGLSDAMAFKTVVLEIPNFLATSALATPSAANRRINAQSSTVITLQSQRCSLFKRRNCSVFERRRQYRPLRNEVSAAYRPTGLGVWT